MLRWQAEQKFEPEAAERLADVAYAERKIRLAWLGWASG